MFERERQSRSECHSQIESLLRQAVKLGQLPADTHTALAMQALHSFMVGIMHKWLLEPSAYDLKKHADALVGTMIAGLRIAPPRKRGTAQAKAAAPAGKSISAPQTSREKIAA